ncbi:hypothetical protein FHX16_006113 [Rhizobium sp. BK661]|nr:hypothetical protein [Rhizobium sp. BK661]
MGREDNGYRISLDLEIFEHRDQRAVIDVIAKDPPGRLRNSETGDCRFTQNVPAISDQFSGHSDDLVLAIESAKMPVGTKASDYAVVLLEIGWGLWHTVSRKVAWRCNGLLGATHEDPVNQSGVGKATGMNNQIVSAVNWIGSLVFETQI